MDGGWNSRDISPLEQGIEPEEPILIWHVFQGVLVEYCREWNRNSYYTHWQRIDHTRWIRSTDRLPTRQDADELNCVVSRNRYGIISVAGWHRYEDEPGLEAWQVPPEPPTNYREMRKHTT